MTEVQPTARTEFRRMPERGSYDRTLINSILDEGLICYISFVHNGRPFVIPTAYGRSGDNLFIHGAKTGRMMNALGEGVELCISVTLVDGLVLARSAFHHSINYRSVMIFGTASVVEDPAEKLEALRCFTEHVVKGRWADVRPPSKSELHRTTVLSVPINEASAKIRTGPPVDDEEDLVIPAWAGVLNLRTVVGEMVADQYTQNGKFPPPYLREYCRG